MKYTEKELKIRMGQEGYKVHQSASVHPDVRIGNNVTIGPNCSIGYNGFNYSRDEDGTAHLKEHKGSVIIEDNVEIHSNVCIDRGLYGDTIIRKGVKIDNLVHVAHDVIIGENTLVVAGTVIGGEVVIGKNNFIGIGVGIRPLVKIGNGNLIGMNSVVIKNIEHHEIWAGNPAKYLRRNKWNFGDEK